MSENRKQKGEEIDQELSDLLDSALQDFSKDEETKEEKPEEEQWSDDFIKQAAAQFESNIASMLGSSSDGLSTEDRIQKSFEKMAEAAQHALTNPEITNNTSNIASTITQTLQGLNQGIQDVQAPFNEADLMNMFTQEGGGQNAFLPFMQGMMQSLLSKDVLYPSLKDILDQFPNWLKENESKITAEDKERYEKQIKLMQDVCTEMEQELESDSAEVKRERFEKVLGLMQTLQNYGQPPPDLVGDVGPGIQFDQLGNPNQCSII